MHPLHPSMADALNRTHLADLQRGPAPRPRRAHSPRERHAVRQATGWFLINLGLRLALPPRPTPQPLSPATR
jgi:hypothetical protein